MSSETIVPWKFVVTSPISNVHTTFVEKQWVYEGLPCVVVRYKDNIEEYRCGYIGVPKTHIAYNKDLATLNIIVIGGLTYNGFSKDGTHAITYMPKGYYWYGFDCSHVNDTLDICTLEFVSGECEKVAGQLNNLIELDVLDGTQEEFVMQNSIEDFVKLKKQLLLKEIKK